MMPAKNSKAMTVTEATIDLSMGVTSVGDSEAPPLCHALCALPCLASSCSDLEWSGLPQANPLFSSFTSQTCADPSGHTLWGQPRLSFFFLQMRLPCCVWVQVAKLRGKSTMFLSLAFGLGCALAGCVYFTPIPHEDSIMREDSKVVDID